MFKIALVDDSVILRSAIRNVLESSGFEVVFEAGGSAELFSKINGSGVGLVLLDIFFPTENGLDILAKLKKHLPAVKVLMVTGLRQDTIVAEAQRLGADGILFKPFDTDELLSSIHRLLPKQGK
ncbi:response regulator [Candidatus Avelusimicrobium aviculae]|uniref:response regulator n=1 Tax=Candidatus Avelusimicrobium aviculae TaxID=3416206 RepID=UPI003D100EFB